MRGASQESLQGFFGVNRPQSPGGFHSHTVKSVVVDRLFQLRHGLAVGHFGQPFDGDKPSNNVFPIGELSVEHPIGDIKIYFG